MFFLCSRGASLRGAEPAVLHTTVPTEPAVASAAQRPRTEPAVLRSVYAWCDVLGAGRLGATPTGTWHPSVGVTVQSVVYTSSSCSRR